VAERRERNEERDMAERITQRRNEMAEKITQRRKRYGRKDYAEKKDIWQRIKINDRKNLE
jgi:hypothetical protein